MAKKDETPAVEPLRAVLECPRDKDGHAYHWQAKYWVLPSMSFQATEPEDYFDHRANQASRKLTETMEKLSTYLASEHGEMLRCCGFSNDIDELIVAARAVGFDEGRARLLAAIRGEIRGMNKRFWNEARHSMSLCPGISTRVMARMIERGLSLEEFATALEVKPREALRRLKSGDFNANQIAQVSNVLEWTPGEVFGQKPTAPERPAA